MQPSLKHVHEQRLNLVIDRTHKFNKRAAYIPSARVSVYNRSVFKSVDFLIISFCFLFIFFRVEKKTRIKNDNNNDALTNLIEIYLLTAVKCQKRQVLMRFF